jgi:hypothetical protein
MGWFLRDVLVDEWRGVDQAVRRFAVTSISTFI